MNYNQTIFFIILYIIVISHIHCQTECDSFKNVTIIITTSLRMIYKLNSFTGCIVPEKIQDHVEEVGLLDQTVDVLKNRSVSGMSELKKLLFFGCSLSDILPGALHDLPNLQKFSVINGNLAAINSKIFDGVPSLNQVSFKQNDISSIADSAFANSPSLKKIDLSNNNLDVINNTWFSNNNSIEILKLSHNSLQKLRKHDFIGTPRLKKLYLDDNDIETIEEETFKNFKELIYVSLSRNRLQEFDANIFGPAIRIRYLLLDVNYLNYLSLELLKKLKVNLVLLDGNPWNCLCLNRIHDWLLGLNGTLRDNTQCVRTDIPRCVYSEETNSHCIEKVDEELTEKYQMALKLVNPPVDESCARVD